MTAKLKAHSTAPKDATIVDIKGKKITLPGLSINMEEALKTYSRGDIETNFSKFYEEKGFPIPDFDKMDRIERLEAINEMRETILVERANIVRISKEKDDNERLSKQGTANDEKRQQDLADKIVKSIKTKKDGE